MTMRKEFVRIIPLVMWLWFIFFMSSQTVEYLSMPPFPGFDKVAHMVVYGVMGALVIYAFPDRLRSERPLTVVMIGVLFALVYGISDEYHQSFVMGRSSEVLDVVADAVGALMAGGLWLVLIKQKQQDTHRT